MTNSLTTMKKFLFSAITLFAFSQCTEEEVVPTAAPAAAVEAQATAAEPTGSFTISGLYTSYESIEDCNTCTYFVSADQTEIDGAELNLKAGSVICLDKAIEYGDLTFTNLEGTEASPIIIGACAGN
jgi:hypothetical protein